MLKLHAPANVRENKQRYPEQRRPVEFTVRASSREIVLECRVCALCPVRHNDGKETHVFQRVAGADDSFKPMANFLRVALFEQ